MRPVLVVENSEECFGFGVATSLDSPPDSRALAGHGHQGRAPIVRILLAFDQAAILEGIDNFCGRAGGDVQMIGEFAQPHSAVPHQYAQRSCVRRCDVPRRECLPPKPPQPPGNAPEGIRERLLVGHAK